MENTGFDITELMSGGQISVWMDYNDQVRVKINHIPRDRFSQIVRKATKIGWGDNHQPTEEFDNLKFGQMLGAEAVADWEGLTANSAVLPCTPENISALMLKWSDFAKFVSNTCTNLERLIAMQVEIEKKN